MLASTKMKLVRDLVEGATRDELIWINGYLAGLTSAAAGVSEPAVTKTAVSKITIVYGTETGNSKKLASVFAAESKSKGINAKLLSLDQYRPNDLIREEYFFGIISTQGDGEPPAAAKKFYDHIHTEGLKNEKLKFSILALGDSSYPLFCKAGEDVDRQLEKAGGQRLVDLVKCDTDYENDARTWFNEVFAKLQEGGESSQAPAPIQKKKNKKEIFTREILSSTNLNDRGSAKETYHIEIEAEGIDYQPGDSIGIIPKNDKFLVEAILAATGYKGEQIFKFRDTELPLREMLVHKLNVTCLPERIIKKYSELVRQEIPAETMGLLDLLKIYSLPDPALFDEVLGFLEPITPRLYSISSSPEAHAGEIHITVAKNIFYVNEESKQGLCSGFLAGLKEGAELTFYIHPNNRFRLPSPDKDIIMVGPGTGIAPFRSFIAERDATGANGKNWLFFGEQHFASDFLYQTEIQNWADTNVLTKVNVAFSRDQAEKIYVQHRMRSQGKELYQWLESGASVYVCGAKEPMSRDVEKTLLDIIAEHGNLSDDQALEFLQKMEAGDRYLKDVY